MNCRCVSLLQQEPVAMPMTTDTHKGKEQVREKGGRETGREKHN